MKKMLTTLLAITMAFACHNTCLMANDETMPNTTTATASASLYGEWTCDAKKFVNDGSLDQFEKADFIMKITPNAIDLTYNMYGTLKEDEIAMELGIKVTGNFKYTKTGNTLKLTSTNRKPTFNMYRFKIIVDDATRAALQQAGVTDDYFKKEFEKEFAKADTFKDFNKGELTIVSLTQTTLELGDEKGEKMIFTRVK